MRRQSAMRVVSHCNEHVHPIGIHPHDHRLLLADALNRVSHTNANWLAAPVYLADEIAEVEPIR